MILPSLGLLLNLLISLAILALIIWAIEYFLAMIPLMPRRIIEGVLVLILVVWLINGLAGAGHTGFWVR